MESDYKKHLDEFVLCIDKQRYYDAHDILEKLWYPRRFDKDDETLLLKGFINAAVSLELIKRGRIEAGKRVWSNYLKYKPLLHKISSPYLNQYYIISRHVENIQNSLI